MGSFRVQGARAKGSGFVLPTANYCVFHACHQCGHLDHFSHLWELLELSNKACTSSLTKITFEPSIYTLVYDKIGWHCQ